MPSDTFDITSPLTPSALPDVANLSASSRFFGAAAAMAFFTAAMKAALSKPPGLAAAIFVDLGGLRLARLVVGGSLGGGLRLTDFLATEAHASSAVARRSARSRSPR